MALHVVIGAGPIGSGTAAVLAAQGHEVRVVTRTGKGPMAPGIQRVAGDATDAGAIARIASGAAAIYNCANPEYHRWATDFPPIGTGLLGAAERTGAVYVSMSNLYGYGATDRPITERDPLNAQTRKGRVRAAMWEESLAAHVAGRVRVTEARAADYFGPSVLESQLGERVFPNILAGKPVGILGRPDVPHSYTYAPDVARLLAVLGTDERAWGRAWHVPSNPPLTQVEAVSAVAAVAGLPDPGVRRMPAFMLTIAGVFSPTIREVREMLYQLERPFVIDGSDATAGFGLTATPLAEALGATVAWWRDHLAAATAA